ncbi:tRNA threonylcarbamoyladenosine dehydratase [Porphyromonas sp.]|uniref:tRNA threonylcarbamoyladenosine dehydratase n=1 Tax=Porphyromonas sp. TaxID=1924944 RepID=UPI0026DCE2EB|nr:tRNA threonylcarbamoyladenosine dehydratase [Porphyromonas sp.]MDO4695723.1 tRNA threonylcarbamoyladenosine dehydratase [Porphyromonas sp.]MDO4771751.1 tRNA threonylcarbamoyladenosine dehydratase [Porphyromonas sp.]
MKRHPETFNRTEMLLGHEALKVLAKKHVLIVGLGGVGGYAVELLVRSGVGELTIVDSDTVQPSNINRQIIATHETIGRSKARLWKERLKAINPDVILHVHETFIRDEITDSLLDAVHYDFAVDAIDTLSPKAHFIKSLQEKGIPFVSSMGAAAKVDPREIKIGRIDKVINCTLARMMRKKLRKIGVPTKFRVIYSTELPDRESTMETDGEQNKKSISGTIAHMPAAFGCFVAYEVLESLMKQDIE